MRKKPLGKLRSLIVIPDWISFADPRKQTDIRWSYKNQDVETITKSSVVFIPVEFSRIFLYNLSYFLLYGIGIYWTKFSLKNEIMTTDKRYLTGLVIPEETWLNSHFNTEPFVFPSLNEFLIVGENLLEFSFNTLLDIQEDYAGQSSQAFGRGKLLTRLVLPLKEPLVMLKEATEKYEEFHYAPAPMRILISEFFNNIFVNEITIESTNSSYEENIPGIQRIKPNLLEIFPKQWSNETYIEGLRQEVSQISEDFALIGAPLILQ
jgi:hypothetical protein